MTMNELEQKARDELECRCHPAACRDEMVWRKVVDSLREKADYAWKNTHILERERQSLQAKLKESEERCERLQNQNLDLKDCVKGALPLIKELPENQWGLGTDGEGTWPIVVEVIHRFEQALSTDANKGEG